MRSVAWSVMCLSLSASPAIADDAVSKKNVFPTLSLQYGSQSEHPTIAGSVGVHYGRLGLELEVSGIYNSFTGLKDWRVGTKATLDLWVDERFRIYAIGRAFFEERHVLDTSDMTLVEQESFGLGVGLGAAARLTRYAEVFGEYVVERKFFDGWNETGVSAMLGLRFRR